MKRIIKLMSVRGSSGTTLTFLLTASHALLQQRLAVEGGEGGSCVLLHP